MKNLSFVFLAVTAFFCIFLLTATFYWGYKESFIILNAIRFPALDKVSLWLTELGNGFYLIILALLLACIDKKHWKTALSIIICVIITAVIVQICKQLLFPHWHRPAKLLQDKPIYILLNPAPHHNSFPSGHSISVMSTATVLSFVIRKQIFEILLAVLACAIAYTRIYTGAHFPADVAIGSLLGIIISIGVMYYARNISLSAIQHKPYAIPVLYGITLLCIIIAILQAIWK
jgi:membrane-associated phospholipid phosphatase